MRPLKFRIWHKKDNEYIGNLQTILLGFDGSVKDVYNKEDITNDVIVEQYTGWNDPSGKEIYEGDILEYYTNYYGKERTHNHLVEWKTWDGDEFGEPQHTGYFDICGAKIIGNIHENKELLDEESQ